MEVDYSIRTESLFIVGYFLNDEKTTFLNDEMTTFLFTVKSV